MHEHCGPACVHCREGKELKGGGWRGKLGEKLICLCILTVFIHAAAAALMRNTFGPISLPYAARRPGSRWNTKRSLFQRLPHTNAYSGLFCFSFFPSTLIGLNHRNCWGKWWGAAAAMKWKHSHSHACTHTTGIKADLCHDKQLCVFSRQHTARQMMVANWELTSAQRSVSAATHHEALGATVHYCMC